MNEAQLYAMRHSLAHITAQAVQRLWPGAKFGVGPVVENGFYYDIDVEGVKISEDDFKKIEKEMRKSYLDYAMSVIVGRALPDVTDGLKPVHRRVLYAMYDGGYRPDRGYFKCTRVIGDVLGNYHPHGDSSVYDALVRLTQPWAMRYPLVDGQGNFGSPGNDPAAAHRYTECRMSPLAMEMVRDIDEETVDFTPNYDGRTMEPLLLPARFPNLLANDTVTLTESLALVLILGLLLALDSRRPLLAGVLTGLLFLTRPNAYLVLFVVIVVVWRTIGWRRALLALGCCVVVMAPWIVRNHVQVGTFRLVTSDGFTMAAIYGPPAIDPP